MGTNLQCDLMNGAPSVLLFYFFLFPALTGGPTQWRPYGPKTTDNGPRTTDNGPLTTG
jgi:hypothetical protein